jgi:hypothetical protein
MTRRWLVVLLTIAALIGSLVIVSCMGDRPGRPGLDELLKEGRRSLMEGDAGEAYNLFREARDIAPEHPQALWGTVLANDLLIWRNLTGIIDLLSGAYVKIPSRDECEQGCARLATCGFFDEFRTTASDCVSNCPWKLQPDMFQSVLSAPTCYDIRYGAAEWIIRTTPANCKILCESLDNCGLIEPPLTYDVQGCIDNCPLMYVEKHSQCYLNAHIDTCNRFDRTCFEHTVNGIQIILQKVGETRVPETMDLSQLLLDRTDDYQYHLRYYKWNLREPAFEINLPGRFSTSELYLSRGLNYFWSWFVRFASAQNLDINTVTFDQFSFSGSTCKVVLKDFLHSIENTMYDPIFPKAGTLKEPYDESLELMKGAGESLGHMFDEFTKMFEAMLGSTDKQQGRSLGYNDDNYNFQWDEDETWTVWDTGQEFTKADVIAFKNMCQAMAANFLGDEPVPLDVFRPILKAIGYDIANLAIDLIEATGRTTFNPSYPFDHPSEDGIRPAVLQLVDALEYLKAHADQLPAFLECGDLD